MDDEMYDLLSLQLAEVEMIQSMFPNPGELEFDDGHAVDAIRSFVEKKNNNRVLRERIGFTLNLNVGSEKDEVIKYSY